MAVLCDSYSEAYSTNAYGISGDSQWGVGQSFIGNGGHLTSCKFYLRRVGSVTGTMCARIYSHSGAFGVDGVPGGSVAVGLADSELVDVSTIGTSYGMVEFTFDTDLLLEYGTAYFVVILAVSLIGAVEWTDIIQTGCHRIISGDGIPTHHGNMVVGGSSAYDVFLGYDLCFEVWSTPTRSLTAWTERTTPQSILYDIEPQYERALHGLYPAYYEPDLTLTAHDGWHPSWSLMWADRLPTAATWSNREHVAASWHLRDSF